MGEGDNTGKDEAFESSILDGTELEEVVIKPKEIWVVAEEGTIDDLKFSLQNGKNVNMPNPVNMDTALIIAAKLKRLDIATLLLSCGADANTTNKIGDTALHWAAFNGDKDMVSTLLSKGAHINAKGEYKNTPLHLACVEGQVDVAGILLQEGASATVKNAYGNNALLLNKNPEIEKMLKMVMSADNGRELLRVAEMERLEKRRIEEEMKMQQTQAIEEERRRQEESDRARMEAILAEERRIEEEEIARQLAEAEELRRQEEERIAAAKAQADKLRKERRKKKKGNKGKKGK